MKSSEHTFFFFYTYIKHKRNIDDKDVIYFLKLIQILSSSLLYRQTHVKRLESKLRSLGLVSNFFFCRFFEKNIPSKYSRGKKEKAATERNNNKKKKKIRGYAIKKSETRNNNRDIIFTSCTAATFRKKKMKNWSITGGEFKFHREFHSVPRPFYCNVITIALYKHALLFPLQIFRYFSKIRRVRMHFEIRARKTLPQVFHIIEDNATNRRMSIVARQESRANVRR